MFGGEVAGEFEIVEGDTSGGWVGCGNRKSAAAGSEEKRQEEGKT
jgi:hypothetical protein